ncbi:hypothetical protein D3C76_1050740 [compost metagenome]
MSTMRERPLARACSLIRALTLSSMAVREKSLCSSAILPASILERSRMSLMMVSRCWAALSIFSSRSCWVLSGVSRLSR